MIPSRSQNLGRPGTGSSRRAGVRRHLWVLLPIAAYAAAACWLTAPLWSAPAGLMSADNPHDATQFSWFLTWTPTAVAAGRLPFYTDLINAPLGVNLMWNTPMPLFGLLLSPLTATLGAAWVVTLLTALGPFLSATSGMLAARTLGAARVPAALGGLLYGFSPAMTAKSLGHVNLLMQPLLPILLVLGVRLALGDGPRRRQAVLLGVLSACQLLINEELLLLTGFVLGLVLVVVALSRRDQALPRLRSATRPYLLALGVFAVLAGPLLSFQVFGPRSGTGSPFSVGYYKADLMSYVVPSRLQYFAGPGAERRAEAFTGGISEQTAYLGWPLLALAAAALICCGRDLRVRATLVPAAVLAFCALGPELAVDGRDTGVVLPWALVGKIPLVENALASRLPLMTDLVLAAGLCFAADFLLRRRRRIGLASVGVWALALLPVVPAPLRVTPIPETPAFFTSPAVRTLPDARRADSGSVLVLPYPTGTETRPMRWQVDAGMTFRMPGGFFIGPADDGRLYIGGQPRPTQRVLVSIAGTGEVPVVTEQLRAQARNDLVFWQTRVIVLGPAEHRDQLATFVTDVVRRPPEVSGGVLIWRLQ